MESDLDENLTGRIVVIVRSFLSISWALIYLRNLKQKQLFVIEISTLFEGICNFWLQIRTLHAEILPRDNSRGLEKKMRGSDYKVLLFENLHPMFSTLDEGFGYVWPQQQILRKIYA